jgi:hypothetical protein
MCVRLIHQIVVGDGSDDGDRRVRTPAGHDDQRGDVPWREVLVENGVERGGNVNGLVVGHDADAAC